MTPARQSHEAGEMMPVPRASRRQFGNDLVSLALTYRRLSHRYRRDADQYIATGNVKLAGECAVGARRYWRDAKRALAFARRHFNLIDYLETRQ